MYVIATDSRRKDETLFMVDRNRQKASFWSNRLGDAMKYSDKKAAIQKAATFRFNNPRAMTLQCARQIASSQQIDRDNDVAMSSIEDGWDGHKNCF